MPLNKPRNIFGGALKNESRSNAPAILNLAIVVAAFETTASMRFKRYPGLSSRLKKPRACGIGDAV